MRLSWDGVGDKLYRAGLDHGVLYLYRNSSYDSGIAWNGLTGVDDSSSGHDKTLLYTNNRRSAITFTPREYGGSIKCYTYPDEFEPCIGNEEIAPGLFAEESEGIPFGFSYRTKIGNDVDPNFAYVIHLFYGAYITGCGNNASTISEDSNTDSLSFSFECLPEVYLNHDPCAHFKIDSRFVSSKKMETLEEILYGSDSSYPRLPLPDELVELLSEPPEDVEYEGYPHDYIYASNEIYPVNIFYFPNPDVPSLSASIDTDSGNVWVSAELLNYVNENAIIENKRVEFEITELNFGDDSINIESGLIHAGDGVYNGYSMLEIDPSTYDLKFILRCRILGTLNGRSISSEWSPYTPEVVPQ